MSEPILVEKNLDGMKEGTQFYAKAVAAEVGFTLAELRRVDLRLVQCRDLERRGLMRFEPPILRAEHPAPGMRQDMSDSRCSAASSVCRAQPRAAIVCFRARVIVRSCHAALGLGTIPFSARVGTDTYPSPYRDIP